MDMDKVMATFRLEKILKMAEAVIVEFSQKDGFSGVGIMPDICRLTMSVQPKDALAIEEHLGMEFELELRPVAAKADRNTDEDAYRERISRLIKYAEKDGLLVGGEGEILYRNFVFKNLSGEGEGYLEEMEHHFDKMRAERGIDLRHGPGEVKADPGMSLDRALVERAKACGLISEKEEADIYEAISTKAGFFDKLADQVKRAEAGAEAEFFREHYLMHPAPEMEEGMGGEKFFRAHLPTDEIERLVDKAVKIGYIKPEFRRLKIRYLRAADSRAFHAFCKGLEAYEATMPKAEEPDRDAFEQAVAEGFAGISKSPEVVFSEPQDPESFEPDGGVFHVEQSEAGDAT